MKRTPLPAIALLLLGLVFALTGCTSLPRPVAKGPPTYAIIASVSNGQAPTDAQWAAMQRKIGAALAARGLVLVTDPARADNLIQVMFIPDPMDPTTGMSYVVGIRRNPGNLIASASSATGVGYGAANTFASSQQYYGYFTDYSDNSSTSTPVAGSSAAPHGGEHHVSRPVNCPPDNGPRNSPGYAGNSPSHSNPPSSGNGDHWWNSHPRSDPSPSGYSSSSDSRGWSRSSSSDSMGPSSSYESSASSSQSMSFPSSSSSSSSDFAGPSSSSQSSSSQSISFPSTVK